MSIENRKRPAPDFSLAFKQMASFVAIAKIRATSEVLEELIQQCFVLLPSDPLTTPEQVNGAIEDLFGIHLNYKDIAMALERLTSAGALVDIGNGHLGLSSSNTSVTQSAD